MGAVTFKFQDIQNCIVSECYIYAPTDLEGGERVKRVKVMNALWDTGASGSLISQRAAKILGLESIGKTGVSGYNDNIDIKETYLIHVGLPTGDIVTNIEATECNSDEYDAVIGMDIICKGDLAITNKFGNTTFSFRIPSEEEIIFNSKWKLEKL